MKTVILILGVAFAAFTAQAQSLLTAQSEPSAQRVAREVLSVPAQTRDMNVAQLRFAFERMWSNPEASPQEILNAMGTDAARLFAINTAWLAAVRAFLVSQGDTKAVAQIDALAAMVPPCTVHSDGTVTITPTPEPEE